MPVEPIKTASLSLDCGAFVNNDGGTDILMHIKTRALTSGAIDKSSANISLLPRALIDLCEVVGRPLLSQPLPQGIALGSKRISLAAFDLRTVDDLRTASPLTVLSLADSIHPVAMGSGEVWPEVLDAMPSLVAPILETVMTPSLQAVFALPQTSNSARGPVQGSKRPEQPISSTGCALFVDPNRIIEISGFIWFPNSDNVGTLPHLPDALQAFAPHDCSPAYVPLLSSMTQRTLIELGCDLNAGIGVLSLSIRTLNCCRKAGDRTVADLVSRTPVNLFDRRNFGPKSYVDVVSSLRAYLTPWLGKLSPDVMSGGATSTSAEPQPPIVSAEPEHRLESAPDDPGNPFAALRNSDLVAALDLYGVSWRDLPVGALAPKSAGKPLAEIADDDSVAPPTHPATASPLDEANVMLRELMQLLTDYGLNPALTDLPAGVLIGDDIGAVDTVTRTSSDRAASILDEIVKSLTTRLLKHMLASDAFQQETDIALASLHRVTIADLLAELTDTTNHNGAFLTPREVETIYARKGLRDGLPGTLDAAGRLLGVTRERIRQIEKRAFERLENNPSALAMRHALGSLVGRAVNALGGVATLADTSAQLGAWIPFGNIHPEATTRFFAEWCQNVTIAADYLFALPLTEALIHWAQQVIRTIVLQQPGIAHDDLIMRTLISGGEQITNAGAGFVEAVIRTLTDIEEQEGYYQPVGRGSLKSRIVHAMRSFGQPATVTEIGAEYRRLYPDDHLRKDNSIRSFFDRFHDTFVCVGLSTYALADWGYDPQINTIAALVERLLGQSDKPMLREEVVACALEKYHWKAQSISAQLDTNQHIRRFGDNRFGLRNQSYVGFKSARACYELE